MRRAQLMRWFSMRRLFVTLGVGVLAVLLIALLPLTPWGRNGLDSSIVSANDLQPFTISSPDFHAYGPMPRSNEFKGFGCQGSNMAPEFNWSNVPAGTKGFAIVINDPDAPIAGSWHHWVVYNIPGSLREIHSNTAFSEGTTSFGTTGYGGPCPPPDGEIHHYITTIYALSVEHIDGKALSYDQLMQAISNKVLGATSIIGTFVRTNAKS